MSNESRENQNPPVIYANASFAERYDLKQLVFEKLLKKGLIENLCETLKDHTKNQPVSLVIDYGTGTGRMIPDLMKTYPQAKVLGVDGSTKMLAVAQTKYRSHEFIAAYTGSSPIAHNAADIVTACMASSYTNEPEGLLASMASSLKVGGLLGLIDSRLPKLKALKKASLAANAMYGDTPESVSALTELYEQILENQGIEVKSIGGEAMKLRLVKPTGPSAEKWGFFGCVLQRVS